MLHSAFTLWCVALERTINNLSADVRCVSSSANYKRFCAIHRQCDAVDLPQNGVCSPPLQVTARRLARPCAARAASPRTECTQCPVSICFYQGAAATYEASDHTSHDNGMLEPAVVFSGHQSTHQIHCACIVKRQIHSNSCRPG